MAARLISTAVLSLAIALPVSAWQTGSAAQTPPPVSSPKPTPAVTPAATPAPQTAAAATKPGALTLTVANEKGEVLAGANVAVHGAVDRGGTSAADGTVTTQNMPPGTYRCRITRDGYIALDKEVTIRAGARTSAEAVLWAAPPPPPPPSPSPTVEPKPAVPAGTAGTPRVVSIPDLAEQMLRESQGTVERVLGCSGVATTKLIATRENIPLHKHPDVDDMLYIVAGDATLTIAEKDQSISAGWYGLVPRGLSYSITRRGRSPMVVLSVESGKPCGGA